MTQDDMGRLSERLSDPNLTDEDLAECYAGLSRINAELRTLDARRRSTSVRFSNGLEMMPARIAFHIRRTSVADFCITYGLTRAEVLERTGMAQAGVV